jgi:hypothetical protein
MLSPSTLSPAGPYSPEHTHLGARVEEPLHEHENQKSRAGTPLPLPRPRTEDLTVVDRPAAQQLATMTPAGTTGEGDPEDQQQAAEEDDDLRGRMQTTAGPRHGRGFGVSVGVRSGGGTGGRHSAAGADSTGVSAREAPVAGADRPRAVRGERIATDDAFGQ